MFGLFKKDPGKDLKRQIKQLSEKAVFYQRNGKIKEYSEVMTKIDKLQQELDSMNTDNS